MTTAPSPYGNLADDIALLATDGKVIRRHDGLYRLNGAPEKLTAAEVRGMAATVRNRRLSAKTALIHTTAGHEITKTREGTPAGDGEGTPVEGRAGSAIAKTCTKCGGPISKWSKGQCSVCYAQAGRGSYPQRPTAEAPDKFWRAVGPSPVNSDAAPVGCVDVNDVPPATTPQTDGEAAVSVTPAPETGASAGPIATQLADNLLGALCGCGALRSHTGRCWHRRGMPGPAEKRTRRTAKQRRPLGVTARILALECEVDALKSANARLEKAVAELRALMSMEGLR